MCSASPYQERYWKELYQLIVHNYYLEIYQNRSSTINKAINIFLAITSSSSICGWAIWSNYDFIWAIIITSSQLITVIKQFLPYRSRSISISKIIIELEEFQSYAEMKWFDVAEGNLTEKEINDLRFDVVGKKKSILKKYLAYDSLPAKEKYFQQAIQLAESMILNMYQNEVEDD